MKIISINEKLKPLRDIIKCDKQYNFAAKKIIKYLNNNAEYPDVHRVFNFPLSYLLMHSFNWASNERYEIRWFEIHRKLSDKNL